MTLHKGDVNDYPYYLRSCAKPLQASLLVDYGLDEMFDLTSEEIALICASNAGEKCHTDIAERLLKKFGLDYDSLKCGMHKPLSRTRQDEMLITKEPVTYLHNNYVELLCGGGIAGFALYYSMHIYCIKHLFRLRKVNEPLSALMFTWCLLMLVMDYGKVSYYSKVDVFYRMTVFLSVEEMKRRQKRKNSMEKQG